MDYGHDEVERCVDLRPAMVLKAKIAYLKELKKQQSIGYGRTFITKRDSLIANLSIGYGGGV